MKKWSDVLFGAFVLATASTLHFNGYCVEVLNAHIGKDHLVLIWFVQAVLAIVVLESIYGDRK